jgi:hypothetical protein
MREALNELREELVAQGWQPARHGAHPWSFTYVQPGLDLAESATGTATDSLASGDSAGGS